MKSQAVGEGFNSSEEVEIFAILAGAGLNYEQKLYSWDIFFRKLARLGKSNAFNIGFSTAKELEEILANHSFAKDTELGAKFFLTSKDSDSFILVMVYP